MLKQLTVGLKLVRHGLQFWMQFTIAIVFTAAGLIMEIAMRSGSIIGGFYIVLSAMFIYQLIISMDISTMVQTSPYKKKLQTTIPTIACTPIILVSYTVVVLFRIYYYNAAAGEPERSLTIKSGFVGIIGLIFLTTLFFGIAYKYFIPAIIILVICVMPVSVFAANPYFSNTLCEPLSMGAIAISGYAVILLGELLAWLLSELLYKKELSKMAFGAAMKRGAR